LLKKACGFAKERKKKYGRKMDKCSAKKIEKEKKKENK
jgi:hypothetical protein